MTTPAASEALCGALRSALHSADVEAVARLLGPLAPEERAALRKAGLPFIQEGLRACRERIEAAWRFEPGKSLVIGDKFLAGLKQPQAGLQAYRLAVVGLGLKKDVEAALFSARHRNLAWDWNAPTQRRLSYQAGLLLIQRAEPWRDDVLCRLLEPDPAPAAWDDSCFDLGLRLLREGAGPQERILAATARQAQRLAFFLHAPEGRFPWAEELGQRLLWAALEAGDDALMARSDYDGRLTARLAEEAQRGRLARGDLISLALRRLAESTRAQGANWWGRLVEKLDPTGAEWAERAEEALDLIGAPNSRALGVGLGAVGGLLSAGVVTPEQAIPLLAIAVTAPGVVSAKASVSLLRRCAREEGARLEALRAALGALQHPKPAVQDAVLGWLEREPWWRDEPEARNAVIEAGFAAPPAAGVRLEALLPAEAAGPAAVAPRDPALETPDSVAAAFRERLAVETGPERRAWLEAGLASLAANGPLPDPFPALSERWRWDDPFRIPADAEETAREMLRVTVGPLDGRAWEALLASVRLPIPPGQRDTVRWTLDPLWKLRDAFAKLPSMPYAPVHRDVLLVLELAEAWVDGGSAGIAGAGGTLALLAVAPPRRMLQHRAALAAIRRRDRTPPLGLPTHRAGWLDPGVLADRLLARADLPEEERFELGAALYRLAPDPEARAAAWARLAPVSKRWGEPACLMLAAALAPGPEADSAARHLVRWFGRRAGGANPFGAALQQALGAARRLVSPGPDLSRLLRSPFLELALISAAMRCRHGLAAIPLLEEAARHLPEFEPFLRRAAGGPSVLSRPWPCDARHVVECRERRFRHFAAGNTWEGLSSLLPELAGYSYAVFSAEEIESAGFAFPGSAALLAASALVPPREPTWAPELSAPLALLRRPDVPLRPMVQALTLHVPKQAEGVGAVVETLLAGLGDGRVRCADVVEAFGVSLARTDARPRQQVQALRALAATGPAHREVAARAVEHATIRGTGGLHPGDRVVLLEALLEWRSEGGRAVTGLARACLDALAAEKKTGRLGSLTRQLLNLQERQAAPDGDLLLRSHDFRALLASADRAEPAARR